jgi:methyltransferase
MTFDPFAAALLGLVTLQRLCELVFAKRNEAALLARGGIEHAAGHYPLIVALHAAWLAGLWWLAIDTRPAPIPVALYALAEVGRAWVLATLGRRWTTRIITVPGETLIAHGPYRFMRHPNYAVVAAEILVLPLAFGLVAYALVFSALNLVVTAMRIRAEERALSSSRESA